jgi:hypothetical protein
MEEQFKKEDRIIRKLVSEAGLEQPGPDFKSALMDQIRQRASEKLQYTPLISKKGWWLLGVLIVLTIVLLYFIPIDNTTSIFKIPLNDLGSMIPEFRFSKTFMYGTIFLGLFLFQIPLLKKYIEPKYQ